MLEKITDGRAVYLMHSIKRGSFELLEQMVEGIKSKGVKIVSPEVFLKDDNPKIAMLTFDDGYEFRDERILSFLKKQDFKVLSFLIILQKNMSKGRVEWDYWRKNLDVFEIGSHTLSHSKVVVKNTMDKIEDDNAIGYLDKMTGELNYSLISKEWLPLKNRFESKEEYKQRLQFEIMFSKDIIERNIGCECKYFAYPWGQYNEDVKSKVIEAGYTHAFSVKKTDDDKYTIPRIQIN